MFNQVSIPVNYKKEQNQEKNYQVTREKMPQNRRANSTKLHRRLINQNFMNGFPRLHQKTR
jgi:hypothetical protein